jgi:hypothetical protein
MHLVGYLYEDLRWLYVCDVMAHDAVNLQAYRRFRVICWFRCQSRLIHPDDENSKIMWKVPTRLSVHKATMKHKFAIPNIITVKTSYCEKKKLFL